MNKSIITNNFQEQLVRIIDEYLGDIYKTKYLVQVITPKLKNLIMEKCKNKPKKKEYPEGIGAWQPGNQKEIRGYNEACDEWETWLKTI